MVLHQILDLKIVVRFNKSLPERLCIKDDDIGKLKKIKQRIYDMTINTSTLFDSDSQKFIVELPKQDQDLIRVLIKHENFILQHLNVRSNMV